MSGLRRAGRIGRKTLPALRPARSQVARIFLLRVLGRVVTAGSGIDWLYFLGWVSDVEPNALRKVATEVADFSSCLKSAPAYDVQHVRQSTVKGRGRVVLLRAQLICMSNHHAEHSAPV